MSENNLDNENNNRPQKRNPRRPAKNLGNLSQALRANLLRRKASVREKDSSNSSDVK